MITVRQRETFTAHQWFPGEDVPGVGLHTVAGREAPEYLLQNWPGGAEYRCISPGDWVLVSSSGLRSICEAALFRRVYIEVQL